MKPIGTARGPFPTLFMEVITLRILKNQDGQSVVEFAIILPVLLLIIMGIVQFGMLIGSYLTLENAAREAARAGIIGSTNAEVRLVITSTSPNLEPGKLTIAIAPSEGSRTSGSTLTVNLTYNYDLTIPIISSLFNNTVVLNAETSMRIE